MKKIMLLFVLITIVCTVVSFGVFIYVKTQYEEAVVELKYGNIEASISKLESIKVFSMEARRMLFELHIDKKFNINNPDKALSYLNGFDRKEKEKIIQVALKYYDLLPNNREFLEIQIAH